MTPVRTPLLRLAQRGVAAIEFALVMLVLLLALYAVATFGAALYTQQAVARAAGEGARALHARTAMATDDVRNLVWDSLAESLVTPVAHASFADRRLWIAAQVTVEVSGPPGATTVTVSYPYRVNRLLPSLPLLDGSRWMPDLLQGRATARP
ncbi:TadE/TadG family type IV pilus assembly protein [Hydrogenophaga sp.]|uniref:TadE/TadG family type IV pilus assembly protein n=1 Tax=Hydrogenophaga sp. TaxID=1904254 RepID=UPI00263997E0|nr:TadE/TadG family type IV pilus assembly protein [Hydrogenophaga sp.]MCW5652847.1 pilus assembly protein [Hydrogenophaga sp.]